MLLGTSTSGFQSALVRLSFKGCTARDSIVPSVACNVSWARGCGIHYHRYSAGDDIASQLAAGGSSTQRPSLSAPRLLAALGLPAASGESGGGLDLTAAAEAAMLDTEQAAHQRRRLATIMSLQPFLRDLTLSAAAAEPLVGAELGCERQSVAALQAQCQALLGRMPTTAVEDEATLSAAEVQQLGPRLQQAVATRLENKRLLLAAAGALQQYAVALC